MSLHTRKCSLAILIVAYHVSFQALALHADTNKVGRNTSIYTAMHSHMIKSSQVNLFIEHYINTTFVI